MDSMCSACGTNAKNVLQIALITLGLVGYILVLVPLIRYRSSPGFAKPHYRLCLSLSISDNCGMLAKLIGLIMSPIYSSSYLWPRLMSFWVNATFHLALSHQLVIAVDRFVALSFPMKEHTFFGGMRLAWSLLFAWLGGLALSVPVLTDKLSYVLINGATLVANVSIPEAALFNKIRSNGIQPGIVLVIFLLYVATGLNVQRIQVKIREFTRDQEEMKARKNYRAQIRLLILAALTTIPLALAVTVYQINIYISMPADLSSFTSFLQNIFTLLVYALGPYVYICFSSEIRARIVELYFKSDVETIKTAGGAVSQAPRKKNRFLSEQRTTKPTQAEGDADST